MTKDEAMRTKKETKRKQWYQITRSSPEKKNGELRDQTVSTIGDKKYFEISHVKKGLHKKKKLAVQGIEIGAKPTGTCTLCQKNQHGIFPTPPLFLAVSRSRGCVAARDWSRTLVDDLLHEKYSSSTYYTNVREILFGGLLSAAEGER